MQPSRFEGACPCGASAFALRGRPLARLCCHCTICQAAYRKRFADVTVFRAPGLVLPPAGKVEFRRHKMPPALRRGSCRHCGAPVLNLLGPLPALRLAFVPTANLRAMAPVPTAAMHIFYHRRVADVADGRPKISGWWPSELAVTGLIARALLTG